MGFFRWFQWVNNKRRYLISDEYIFAQEWINFTCYTGGGQKKPVEDVPESVIFFFIAHFVEEDLTINMILISSLYPPYFGKYHNFIVF